MRLFQPKELYNNKGNWVTNIYNFLESFQRKRKMMKLILDNPLISHQSKTKKLFEKILLKGTSSKEILCIRHSVSITQ